MLPVKPAQARLLLLLLLAQICQAVGRYICMHGREPLRLDRLAESFVREHRGGDRGDRQLTNIAIIAKFWSCFFSAKQDVSCVWACFLRLR